MIQPGANLHFDPQEFAARQAAVIEAMTRRGLAALLMFRQESMYWLTGYDTFGYVHFQALVLTDDGRLVLLTRSADRLQARFTSPHRRRADLGRRRGRHARSATSPPSSPSSGSPAAASESNGRPTA